MRGSWWGRFAGAAALVLWTARAVSAVPPLDVLYEIDATLSPSDHTLSGRMLVTLTNRSGTALHDVMLMLYPNLYREPDATLDRTKMESMYPRTFSPGSMTLTTIETEGGTLIEYGIVDYAGPRSHTLARAFLPRPIPVGGTIRFRVGFSTVIPEKYGVFGYFHGVTLLKGGWHPFVPAFRDGEWAVDLLPDPARFDLRIRSPRALNLAGADLLVSDADSGMDTWIHRSESTATVALAWSPLYHQRVEQAGATRLRVFYLPEDRPYVRDILDAMRHGLAFYRKEYGDVTPPEILVASGYLHQNIVSAHEGLILVSTRLFKVFSPLKKYHEADLVKGLLFALWRERLPEEEAWVLEGLAEAGTQLYLRDRYRRAPNLLRWLKPFAFHPVIDQILYSNRLPLRQIYFKESNPITPREDIAFFNNKRPDGATMLFKLTALLGEDTINRLFQRYVDLAKANRPVLFRTLVQEHTDRDLDWFYRQWLSVNPSTDFAIEHVEQVRKPDGYHTTVDLTKTGEGIEPVKIQLRQRKGPPVSTTWLSYEPSHRETFVTPSSVRMVELDPEHKTSDFQRGNDRTPPALKLILEKFPGVSYDFQTKTVSYDFSAYLQRRYDENNVLRMSYAKNETSTSGTVVFSHSYDQTVGNYSTRQSLSLGFAASRPFVAPRAVTETPDRPFTAVRLTHVLSNARVPLVYSDEIQQLVFGAIPYSTLSTTFSQKILGSDHPSALLFRLDMRRQWSFGTLHEIAGRAVIGQSAGGFHEERRFGLGGSSGMRGYSPSTLIGESMLLGSLEYRQPVFREIDSNLWGVTLLRRLQLAVFADIGAIHGDRYRTDAGAGFRLTHEFLGLYPVVTRFDIAFPIGVEDQLKPDEQNPHFYVTAGQPF